MKKIISLLLALCLILSACGNQEKKDDKKAGESKEVTASESAKDDNKEKVVIKIGVSPTPHKPIVDAAKDLLEKEGITLEIKEFEDYVIPNKALAAKDIDANFFQHKPYLDNFNKENNLNLVSLGAVHLEPIAAYSAKIKSLSELQDGAKVLIPNDVTNGARALLLLEKEGLIKLDDPKNINATEANIVENKKNLTFVPMDAAMIARTYKDSDLAIINSNFALDAGLNPLKDGLAIEDKDSPYANIIAVRSGEENEEKFQKLIKALNSEQVRKFIEEEYKGAIIPAF